MTTNPSFDGLAPAYHWLERITFGSLLHRCRTAHLERVLGSKRALLLGDGDGRFLADLLNTNPLILVDSLDISKGMAALARRRIAGIEGAVGRVRFIHADARSFSLTPTRYDLIVTNFFLDCFTAVELPTLIDRLAVVCLPGSIWLDGDFRLPAGRWRRFGARVILAVMYLFFVLTTRLRARQLIDPAPCLAANGFTLASEMTGLGGFLSSRCWVRTGTKSTYLLGTCPEA